MLLKNTTIIQNAAGGRFRFPDAEGPSGRLRVYGASAAVCPPQDTQQRRQRSPFVMIAQRERRELLPCRAAAATV
jgi:hypothetical protein